MAASWLRYSSGRRRRFGCWSRGRRASALSGLTLNRCQVDVRLVEHFALEDPDLHADHAVRRARLGQAVVDVSTEGVQRDAAFAVPLRTGDFATDQTA